MSCPVCFGGEDPVARESLNAGIGVLMGVTAIVLGCFARFFVVLARRARAYQTGFGLREEPASNETGFDFRTPATPDNQTRFLRTEP